jgi:hypothetical protein
VGDRADTFGGFGPRHDNAALLAAARAERDRRGEAGDAPGFAIWTTVAALVEHGSAELPDDAEPRIEWERAVAAVQAALGQRMRQCAKRPTPDLEQRISALASIRALLIPPAIRAGATILSEPA